MACLHKFYEYLNLNKSYKNAQQNCIDFDPITLIVGTFNPSWPEANSAEWFYGRLRNNYLWDVLPRLFNHEHNLRLKGHNNHVIWQQFCYDNKVAITDLVYSINDADINNKDHKEVLGNYLDTSIGKYFKDFEFTNIVQILDSFPTIKNVYFTRQGGIELFDNRWSLVEKYGIDHLERNLHIRKLITPSASARFQIKQYKQENSEDKTPLRNFIYTSWLENWHAQ